MRYRYGHERCLPIRKEYVPAEQEAESEELEALRARFITPRTVALFALIRRSEP
jgi:hypothetical protein